MSDLISRQDAIDVANMTIPDDWLEMLLPKLESLPSVQSDVPDKNVGKWIYRKRYKNDKQPELVCPFCGEAIGWWDTRNFCANCGAKLEEPEDKTNVRKPD